MLRVFRESVQNEGFQDRVERFHRPLVVRSVVKHVRARQGRRNDPVLERDRRIGFPRAGVTGRKHNSGKEGEDSTHGTLRCVGSHSRLAPRS